MRRRMKTLLYLKSNSNQHNNTTKKYVNYPENKVTRELWIPSKR